MIVAVRKIVFSQKFTCPLINFEFRHLIFHVFKDFFYPYICIEFDNFILSIIEKNLVIIY